VRRLSRYHGGLGCAGRRRSRPVPPPSPAPSERTQPSAPPPQGYCGEPRVFRTVRYWPISGGDLAVQVLVVDLVWGLVGECRVESFRIVSEFDVSRNVVDGVSAGRILGTMDPLVLQDGEE